MNLNVLRIKDNRKCFKYKKSNYIHRFYRNKTIKVANVSDSENKSLLTLKKSQKKEL